MTFGGIAAGTNTIYKYGDYGPGGGRVVYDNGSYASWGRYIEAVNLGNNATKPMCNATSVQAFNLPFTLGSSYTNTTTIINNFGSDVTYNAAYCRAYTGGGFTNWSLPCYNDYTPIRDAVFATPSLFPGTYYGFSDWYWTSSWSQGFAPSIRAMGGGQSSTTGPTNPYYFFAVRYF